MLKFSFSDKATKICVIFLMVLMLTKQALRKIAQLFVAFSEKLSNLIFVKELTPRPNLDFV